MTALLLITNLVLLLAAAAGSYQAWSARRDPAAPQQLLSCWALACLFIALAVLGRLLPGEVSTDLAVLQRMALNLGVHIGLPFLACALLMAALQRHWSGAGWGRLLLGLFACFELSRQLGYGSEYTRVLGLLCTLGAGSAALMFARGLPRRAALSGVLCLIPGLAFSGALPTTWVAPQPALFPLLCALALVLFSLALHRQLQSDRRAPQ